MILPYKQKHYQVIRKKLGPFLVNIDTPMWNLSYDTYQKSSFKQILTKVASINIQTFISTNTNCCAILRDLSITQFPCLRILNLSMNNIETLEGISEISAPFLTHLYFDYNYITNLAPLRKSNFPELIFFSLQRNMLVQFERFEECQLPKLQWVGVKQNLYTSLNLLFKCEFSGGRMSIGSSRSVGKREKSFKESYKRRSSNYRGEE